MDHKIDGILMRNRRWGTNWLQAAFLLHDLGACLPMSPSLEFGFGQTTNGRSGLNFCAFDLGSLFALSIFLYVILRLGCVCDAVKLERIMLKSGEGGGG